MAPWVCPGLAGVSALLTPGVLRRGLALVGGAVAEAERPHGAMHHPYCTAIPHAQKGGCLQPTALIFQPRHPGSAD